MLELGHMRIIENYYDIVILLPSSVREYCIELSEEINRSFGSTLVLGKRQALPHVSLFHTAFTEENLRRLKKKLSSVAKKIKPFQTHIKDFLTYPEYGSLALEVLPKDNFVPLHREIISVTKNIIDYNFDYHAAWNSQILPPKMKKYIEEYTTPLVKEYFIPHITLSLLKDKEKLPEVVRTIEVKHQQFRAEKITVCKLGEHHACQEILFSVSFQ